MKTIFEKHFNPHNKFQLVGKNSTLYFYSRVHNVTSEIERVLEHKAVFASLNVLYINSRTLTTDTESFFVSVYNNQKTIT